MARKEKPGDVTALIYQWCDHQDRAAYDKLTSQLIGTFRKIAQNQLKGFPSSRDATDIVHDVWLRLVNKKLDIADRIHLFRTIAMNVRRELCEEARSQLIKRNGGGVPTLSLDEHLCFAVEADPHRFMTLNQGMAYLSKKNKEYADILDLRITLGLTVKEISQLTNHSIATVNRYLRGGREIIEDFCTGNHEASTS